MRLDILYPEFTFDLLQGTKFDNESTRQIIRSFEIGLAQLRVIIERGPYLYEKPGYFHDFLYSFYRNLICYKNLFTINGRFRCVPYRFIFIEYLIYNTQDNEQRFHLLRDFAPLYSLCKYIINKWIIILPVTLVKSTSNNKRVRDFIDWRNREIAKMVCSAWAQENNLRPPGSISYNKEKTKIHFKRMNIDDIDYLNLSYYSKTLVSKYINILIKDAMNYIETIEKVCDIYKLDIKKAENTINQNTDNFTEIKEEINENVKYETLKSTYRRAAVMALIEKSGLCKNIDKTRKAAFVEAVTGGNINANPKDTASYKTPTKQAKEEAKKLLKMINVNI